MVWNVKKNGVQSTGNLTEDWCYAMLRRVRWPNGISCPYCRQRHVTTHTRFNATSRRRYLCLGCRKTFTDLTGTPFERTNLSLHKWFLYLDLMEEGLTTCELARKLQVKWDTTAYMKRRLTTPFKSQGFIKKLCEAAKERRFG